jgi:hypothetical protein
VLRFLAVRCLPASVTEVPMPCRQKTM